MALCEKIVWTEIGLCITLLITGTLNVIGAKFMNVQKVVGSDGVTRFFNHPFVQGWGIFIGGFLILLIISGRLACQLIMKRSNPDIQVSKIPIKIWFFLPPALLDMVATSLIYVALVLTHPSSCQMLRGTVIIFTALLSNCFLGHKLDKFKWAGVVIIIIGLGVVGATDLIWKEPNEPKKDQFMVLSADNTTLAQNHILKPVNYHPVHEIILGDALIIVSQILVAFQFVYEEKYVVDYKVPVTWAVGIEALFGLTTMSLLLIPMYFISMNNGQNPRGVMEDAIEAFDVFGKNPILLTIFLVVAISIGLYNLSGLKITQDLSATTRVVLDSMRTLIIWIICLGMRWQTFRWLHLGGFLLYIVGMCCYNHIGTSLLESFWSRYYKPKTLNTEENSIV